MHESRLVAQLIERIEAEVDPAETRITHLALRVGALSAVASAALRDGVEEHTARAWGYAPTIEVERSDVMDDPGGLGVTLVSIQVEG